MDPYEALANAIITQAARDFREADKESKKSGTAEGRRLGERKKAGIAMFFVSDWFGILSNADGMQILQILERETVR